MTTTMPEIRRELNRVNARDVFVRLDPEFEPDVSTLLEVSIDGAYWHMLPSEFLELSRRNASGQGPKPSSSRLKEMVSSSGNGPAPRSRDTSP